MNKFKRKMYFLTLIGLLVIPSISSAEKFDEQSGEEIYNALCAGCHMPDGKGAVGAGMYPSFVGNEKISNETYPQIVVLYGLHGMPALGGVLDDNQIANVINFVRKKFGGYDADVVTPEEVLHLRVADYDYNDLN